MKSAYFAATSSCQPSVSNSSDRIDALFDHSCMKRYPSGASNVLHRASASTNDGVACSTYNDQQTFNSPSLTERYLHWKL